MVAARGMVHIPRQADIVLASAGGFPKDLDFVQGHKALESAKYFVRDGGIIILASKCSDGIGNKVFESWLLDSRSPDEIIEHIQREFVLGGHMAAALALILKRAFQIFRTGISARLGCNPSVTHNLRCWLHLLNWVMISR
jgi:nickel-dependent lactate racemase